MNNYAYCAKWIVDQKQGDTVQVLDYGCGSGNIVKALKGKGIDAYGCDIFYEGGDRSEFVGTLLSKNIIKRMQGNEIPFDNNSFDYVVTNQVMEHVENLDIVLSEITRVLKPGGKVLSIFPHKETWREGHVGIPLLHWFSEQSSFRVYYAATLRAIGLGYNKKNKSIMEFSNDACKYIDNWTHYRTKKNIYLTYNKYFSNIQHLESHWLLQRLENKKKFLKRLSPSIHRLIARKFSGLVFVAQKQ